MWYKDGYVKFRFREISSELSRKNLKLDSKQSDFFTRSLAQNRNVDEMLLCAGHM